MQVGVLFFSSLSPQGLAYSRCSIKICRIDQWVNLDERECMVPACHGFLNTSGLPFAACKAPVHILPACFHTLLAHPLLGVHSALGGETMLYGEENMGSRVRSLVPILASPDFRKKIFFNLFLHFWLHWSSLLRPGLLYLRAWVSACSGSSCCAAWALACMDSVAVAHGLNCPQHEESFQTRD